jgi:hypothetical protein
MDVDSMKKAYARLLLETRSTPSAFVETNTLGLDDSMNDHIRWYSEKLEFWCTQIYYIICIVSEKKKITEKNAAVEPPETAPYLILVCLAKSSADSMVASILSTVRKAAKLAV